MPLLKIKERISKQCCSRQNLKQNISFHIKKTKINYSIAKMEGTMFWTWVEYPSPTGS